MVVDRCEPHPSWEPALPATSTNCWGSLRATHSQAPSRAQSTDSMLMGGPSGPFLIESSPPGVSGGLPRRYRRSLNHKLCRLGIGRCYYFDPFGTLREIKVFGFWGEYGPFASHPEGLHTASWPTRPATPPRCWNPRGHPLRYQQPRADGAHRLNGDGIRGPPDV